MAKDGTIILDLDEVAEAKHTTFCCKHCDLAPSLREELVTIQYGSLKPMVIPLIVPITFVEAKLVPDVSKEDDEGLTLVTRRRPKKQMHIQPLALFQRKKQGRKRKP